MMDTSITDRLLDAFPSGSYGLLALLRLLDIVETTRVATACVECTSMPLMLINPEFIEKHAATPERLLMLVMHELHHVLLGHTRLFPRVTPLDNLVFDAVINSWLCRMFPKPDYTSLFTEFYKDDCFPECILRPPSGWNPVMPARWPPALKTEELRPVREVYRALYSEVGASYDELYSVLKSVVPPSKVVRLIGSHGAEPAELDGLIFDTVRSIVEHWPQPPDPIRGRSWSNILRLAPVRPRRSNRRTLRGLIRKVAGPRGTAASNATGSGHLAAVTPIPTADRRAIVLRALATPQLLYRTEATSRTRERCDRVHVYVDVSGSIGELKGPIYGAVLDCSDLVYPAVHLFSTVVYDVSFAGLRIGECRTTNGTSIECVAAHMKEHHVRRAVLLTDGWVGSPGTSAAETLAGVKVGVALTSNSNRSDLEKFTDFWAELEGAD